jgi:zinc/manganese transport system permease protein
MFAHDFVRNAYLAGTAIGLGCGIIGWFVVLRGQLFAGDALSHVAFVGAIAAAVLGLDERVGLFVLTVAMATGMAALGPRSQAGDTVIGLMFAWFLGLGLLLLSVLATSAAGGSGISAANTLFGSIYSLGAGASRVAALIALGVGGATLLALRPLLLASLDAELAAVRGVPVRVLGAGFLIALALLTADGTQAIGALLMLGLLSAPAGAAHQLTADPRRGIALSALLAVGSVWAGLALSYAVASIPPSSAIIGLAGGAYALAAMFGRLRRRARPAIPPAPGVRHQASRHDPAPAANS